MPAIEVAPKIHFVGVADPNTSFGIPFEGVLDHHPKELSDFCLPSVP